MCSGREGGVPGSISGASLIYCGQPSADSGRMEPTSSRYTATPITSAMQQAGTDVALPARSTTTRGRRRLRAEVAAVGDVDAVTRQAAWKLFDAAYAGAELDRFDRDFDAKHRVILLRDADDGSLRGFSTVHLARLDEDHRATLVYSGDTVVDPAYWGTQVLQRAFAALLVREKLRRPVRPLYWFLISKGYKTYLMLAHAFPQAIPRRGETADSELRRLLDIVAGARFGAAYDPATGIIRHAVPHEAVRAGLCPVDDGLLTDPDVAFFFDRNPGHADGDELACLARVRLGDLLRRIARSLRPRPRTRR